MHCRKLVFVLLLACWGKMGFAQEAIAYEEANTRSYALYEKAQWKELLQYGKTYLQTSPDFALLRMRMGYAAFMLNNFSEALAQYEAALKNDSYNEAAHYYAWLCRRFLNQPEQADAHVKYFTKETLEKEKIKAFAVTGIGTEVSYKMTDINPRMNGLYARADVNMRLHPNINMQHSVAIYNQTIAEPKLPAVIGNNSIAINQKEYYNKTIINLSSRWQAIGAYHYAYTPFNNFAYNNQVGLVGLKFNHHYFAFQADAIVGKLTDTSLQQYNATLSLYPLGNLHLYSFSTASFSNRTNKSAFNFKQVLGAKITKWLWLEGNVTLNRFSNFFEHDALYIYNAIDPNLLKAGATAYIPITPKITLQAGYTFERRELFQTNFIFNQYSITGGLSCQF